MAQQKFKLHVQPGKTVMAGDGDDYTTLVITARNEDGEIVSTVNGKVKIGISSGLIDESEVKMESGIALVKFTSPMFGTPIKSSQRMVYFLFRFMQKFLARSAGSTSYQANQKLATNIALETFKEGLNPIALIPKKDNDNFVYIVCDINGVKGKAKIEIKKESDSRNGNIVPGIYYGRDITGQSDWYLDLYSSGEGYFGEANTSIEVANKILFTTENFTEFNDAMGKMAGMGGFMKAYLGPNENETKYMENYNIRENGMPSAYMPMPNNGVFVYIPPILFEYAGRKANSTSGNPGDEVLKTEKTGIILSQDKIVGDGRSKTKAVFHYEDENGLPVVGKTITWSIPKGLKIISIQSVTDASGNAEAVLEAPVIKASDEKRGDNTGGLIDNYDLYQLTVQYTSAKDKNESTQTTLCIYKTLEQNLYILKPGMETSPYKVLLPQLEYYNLESSIYALLPASFLSTEKQKVPVSDAIIFVESRNFDKEEFWKLYTTWFKKDRKLFMSMLENPKGGYSAIVEASGKFKLIIRDFEGKMRLASGGYDRKMAIESLEAKIADLTGRRTGALTEVLGLLSAGSDASGNAPKSDGTFTGDMVNSLSYKEKVYKQIHEMEGVLCSGSFNDAMCTEEKLHILGMLMTNAKGTARFMGDTGNELIGHGWELLGMAWEFANEKFKISEKIGKKVGFDKVSDSLAKIGMKIDLGFWSKVTGTDRKTGTKRIIMDLIKKNVLSPDITNKNKASGAWYRAMGQAADGISGFVFESLTEGISDALSEANPVPDMVVESMRRKFYAGLRSEVDIFLAQTPEKVHALYPVLQPALHDRSTEIRSYYQSVASSRFNWEMYKSDIDLFRDVVVKGAIIVTDLYTMKWHQLKNHLENLDKFNKVCDAAYTTSMFAQEIWRYHYLWCEARGAFDYTNRSIGQGALVTTMVNPGIEIGLFNAAYAADPPKNALIPSVTGISGLDFALQNGQFPVANINKAIDANVAYTEWIKADHAKLTYLTGFKPEIAGAMYKSAQDFENLLSTVLVHALVYAEVKSAANQEAYNHAAGALKKGADALSASASNAKVEMDKMPEKLLVPIPETDETSGLPIWKNPVYQKIGAGIAIALVLGLVTIIFIRRRRRQAVSLQTQAPTTNPFTQSPAATIISSPQSSIAHSPAPTIVISPASSHSTSAIPHPSSPKFCPQCGNSFKAGAKFCGKCGYKTT